MKLSVAFMKSLAVAVTIGLGSVSLWAQAPEKPDAEKNTEAPAADADAAESTVPGNVIARANGGFLSLSIEGNAFKLAFYDAKKKQVEPDVARATARWDPSYKVGVERRVLNPSGDGKTFTSPPIRPPYRFKVFLNLLSEQGEAVESYVVDFRD